MFVTINENLFAKLRRISAQDSFPLPYDCDKNITMDVVRVKVVCKEFTL